jgi:hypothetical protein
VLQIANDIARLNVKKSILALEDAIAAKDEQAIIAATAKLNADLKVLGTLGAQNLKLLDIKSLLESLKPKDLINLSNLEAALALLGKINLASTGSTKAPATTSAATTSSVNVESTSAIASLTKLRESTNVGTGINFLLKEQIDQMMAVSNSRVVDEQSQRAAMNITVNTGVGDPNAIAEAIENVITEAVSRGTLRGLQIA